MIQKTKLSIIFSFILLCLFPVLTHALIIDIEKPKSDLEIGDTVVLKVSVDTEEKEINAIDGNIKIEGDFVVEKIYTGNSIFTLWPKYPTYNNGKIEFVGGLPGSVFGNRLHLFSIAIKATGNKKITFTPENITFFMDDGKGTSNKAVVKNSTSIPVSESTRKPINEMLSLISKDNTPPQYIQIEYGKDPSIFDNKIFLTFTSKDHDSNVEKYIVEEDGAEYETIENIYVLKNQEAKNIKVTSVDSNGNTKTQNISLVETPNKYTGYTLLIIIVIFGLLIFVFLKKRNKYKNVQ